MRAWILACVALAATACGPALAPSPPPASAPPRVNVDVSALRTVELATEDVVNRMLDLAVAARDGDRATMASIFAPHVTVSMPQPGDDTAPAWKWIRQRAWSLPAPEATDAAGAAAAFDGLAAHWGEAEDVRFKVKSSEPRLDATPPTVDGHFKSWIVGRNTEGRREWLRGEGDFRAVLHDGAWRVEDLAFTKASSLVATRDLVSEVSGPAGVARPDPSLVERGARGLLAHGAAAADVDGDGLVDVFSTGLGRHALFRNRGDGTFEDVADAARVFTTAAPGGGPVFLDADNDGDQDLFVSGLGRQTLFENRLVPDGTLVFRDVTDAAGLRAERSGFSAVAGDVNGDGLPDIYVAAYNDYGNVVPDSWDRASNGQPNLLFVNQGGLRFREEAQERGVADAGWSYAALLADIDDDADLDVFVANDFGGPNALYLNDGTGRFANATEARGLAEPGYGMGASLGDYDRDGDLDLHVTKMSSNAGRRILSRFDAQRLPSKSVLEILASGNSLHENQGGGTFREVTATAGPFSASWAWGGGFFDLDLDAWPDLYVPNGFLSGTRLHDT